MASRVTLTTFLWVLISSLAVNAQSDVRTKWVETCENFCYALILKGQLIDTLEFSGCTAISGMTCHIMLKEGARLPSRVFLEALDSHDKPLGKKRLLIYPELKPKESGSATFSLRIPRETKTVVLTGEWNGPYRSAY